MKPSIPLTKSDMHTHFSLSTLSNMVQAAHDRGVKTLGISEHLFQLKEARPLVSHLPQEGALISLAQYRATVEALEEQYKGQVDLRLGLEVDFLPEKQEAIQAFVQPVPWDFLIGSVHELRVGDLIDDVPPLNAKEGQERWLRYFSLLRQAVTCGCFDVVSHPLRMRAENPWVPATFQGEVEHLAATATQANVALEINGTDIHIWPDGVRALIQACARRLTPVSVGSDAHMPEHVARAHAWSTEALIQAGITTVRIWKQRVPQEVLLRGNDSNGGTPREEGYDEWKGRGPV
jgi:histidinol-phosphatase (PHP family)